jgi:hypothetical protein
VLLWDLETLEPLHPLRQPAGNDVWGLASVWGALGDEVFVWGLLG